MTEASEQRAPDERPAPDERRVFERAHDLTPEERAVGSDDPMKQAAAILADSDERTEDPEGTKNATDQTPS